MFCFELWREVLLKRVISCEKIKTKSFFGCHETSASANSVEYVELYTNYIVNDSVKRQFEPFARGFHLVCGGEVFEWFRWEELELLVCGSKELDFGALEEAGASSCIVLCEQHGSSCTKQASAVFFLQAKSGFSIFIQTTHRRNTWPQ